MYTQNTFNIYFFYLHYVVGVIYFVTHVCSSFIFNAICQLYECTMIHSLFLVLYMNLFLLVPITDGVAMNHYIYFFAHKYR